jgi:hypothetical protein
MTKKPVCKSCKREFDFDKCLTIHFVDGEMILCFACFEIFRKNLLRVKKK